MRRRNPRCTLPSSLRRKASAGRRTITQEHNLVRLVAVVLIVVCAGWIIWRRWGRGRKPTAQRIKISTSDRVVTLRGLVNSPQERDRIEAKVQYIAGQNKVDNQLELKPLTPQ